MTVSLSILQAVAYLAAILLSGAGAVVLLKRLERRKAPAYIAATGVAGFVVASSLAIGAAIQML